MKKRKAGAGSGAPPAERTLWVHGYEMIPPHQAERMAAIRGLLDQENSGAARQDRNWTARLVTEETVTHVLIVTASPDENRDINQRLESQMRALGFSFHVSVPMPI